MEIVIITGCVGEGKTLYMTYLANKYAKKQNGYIISNYPMQKEGAAYSPEIQKIYAIDEIHMLDHFWNNIESEAIFICTTPKIEFIASKHLTDSVQIIEVIKEGNEIIASNGDRIKIEDHCEKYNSFVIPSDTFVLGG